jgi:hypothetical protein
MTDKATALRESAAENRRKAEESFDRCDTDGFLSQWAHGITAQQKDKQAEIEDKGGVWEFLCLIDEDGELVPAREIKTRYGLAWGLFNTIEEANAYDGQIVEWISNAKIKKGAVPYRYAFQIRPAKAVVAGEGKGLSGAASCYIKVIPTDKVRLPADAPIVEAALRAEEGHVYPVPATEGV